SGDRLVTPGAPPEAAATLRARLGRLMLVTAGAGLLALAFPRVDWDGGAWVALVPLFVVVLEAGPRVAAAVGWLFGTIFFLVLLRWLNFTFLQYSAIPWPLTWLPTALLAAYCGLYPAAVAGALAWIGRRRSLAWALLAAPFLWVAAEWLRGHLLGGFPWGTLGYTQYLRLSVIQIAELAGVHAVSFLVVAVNAAVAGCLILPWRRALAGTLLAGAAVGATLAFGTWRLAAPAPPAEVTVAVMQPAIDQPLKWDERHRQETLAIYFALTRRAARDHPDLIVWPETASPSVLRRDPDLLDALSATSETLRVPLLVGSVDVEGGPPVHLRNTAFLVTGGGIAERYDKIHLVPFGEYVPLSGVIGFVRGWAEFISELEPGSRTVVFQGPPAPFGVVICYEGVFPDLVREFVRNGARLMVNMTNDAWFGRTSGPEQHLAMYPLRAVEHRVALARAANTGVSAFIAPTGQIVRRLPLFERGTLTERLPLRRGDTLFTRVGDWLAWLSLAVSAAVLGSAGRRGGRV
ncbi:MAG TPA: apolipoprotein N-acyltransferase, partial [Methylomirabilota bacterium]|nr:apolipoprotein N-acyltransferase [Methylomirabilota bacterium]